MIKYLVHKAMEWCERRGKIQKITGSTIVDKDDIYLVRYVLFASKWFSIYLHQFLRSDRDTYHDHPWSFSTYVVSGAYTEHKPKVVAQFCGRDVVDWKQDTLFFRSIVQNRFVNRQSTDFHWVEIQGNYTYEERWNAPTTICLIGKRTKTWGFIDPNTGEKIFWKKFLNIPYENEDFEPTRKTV
jgi:hypothetical protein